ncbi:MAG: asparagine--tRNA ligase [Clostridia bacterium]|nr:asparagine--tRNA ligase [Clostridia bacterium]
MKTDVKSVYKDTKTYANKEIEISGWVRTARDSKTFGFIELNDGSFFKNIQVVYENNLSNFEELTKLTVSSSLRVKGILVETPEAKQPFEIKATNIEIECLSPSDYPLQKKGHTIEFLREQAYLRPRTNLFNAVFRIRSVAAMAIHTYFQSKGYVYVNTPLITANDGEGAGEMFQITTLDLDKVAETGKVDYSRDFFGKQVGLTVTGQLEGETFAMAYGKIYTFGPTFRAENSNTKTHASEFWMIEPEIAFCDLEGLMDVEEDMLKYIVQEVLEKCPEEMNFLNKFVAPGLIEKLEKLLASKFTRISHEEVITILKDAKVEWEFKPEYGEDIAKEHEKYITEYFNGPVFITNWPKDIKAFYMKQNSDGKTVAAVDLEVPGAGELMGGSQREENYEKLLNRMNELGMKTEGLDWYLNLRKYGSCVHSGFGMGFERLLIYLTGVENIRDVIPYPRTPGNCEY